MEIAAIAIVAVIVLAFLAALAALAFAGFKLFFRQQEAFFQKLSEMQATHQADREADQAAYAQFMDAQEAREQVLEQADQKWMQTPESAVEFDDDLKWGDPDG